MAVSFGSLIGMIFEDDPMETRPQHNNLTAAGAGVLQRNEAAAQDSPVFSYNNSGTQAMRGLINNTDYTKGNGNGSIILGNFECMLIMEVLITSSDLEQGL